MDEPEKERDERVKPHEERLRHPIYYYFVLNYSVLNLNLFRVFVWESSMAIYKIS